MTETTDRKVALVTGAGRGVGYDKQLSRVDMAFVGDKVVRVLDELCLLAGGEVLKAVGAGTNAELLNLAVL